MDKAVKTGASLSAPGAKTFTQGGASMNRSTRLNSKYKFELVGGKRPDPVLLIPCDNFLKRSLPLEI